ncbi:MAG TPA: LamG-like jellyroll fold domain-containing protein [Polyangiaceae bacterium]|jgi:hypothetical protein|nr:LamG-like jellyroll fold domain-containing protein [Polyangiaceae bacterium]
MRSVLCRGIFDLTSFDVSRSRAMRRLAALAPILCLSCGAAPSSRNGDGKNGAPKNVATSVGVVDQASTIAADYRATVLNDGAKGYWRLGELLPNTGNLAHDEVSPATNGQYVATFDDSPLATLNQPGALPASTDRAALFYLSNSHNPAHSPPGQSTWVSIPHQAYQSGPQLSLECWFTMTPGGLYQTYSSLFHKSTADMHDGYGIYYYSGKLYFWVNQGSNNGTRIGIPLPSAGVYHHIVATYGGGGTLMNLYLDGVLAASAPLTNAPTTINAGTAPLWIGKGWLALGWQGLIDEPAVYNTVLTPAQILRHYQAGSSSTAASPIEKLLVYGNQRVTFGTGVHTLGGDIGVASVAPASVGTQLIVGASDNLDPTHRLMSPSVTLAAQSIVGDVNSDHAQDNGATAGTLSSYPHGMPRLPLASPATPGTAAVTVAAGQTQTLSPGNYGILTVNGILNLNPGTYSFASVRMGNGAQLLAMPGVADVRVAGAFSTGTSAVVSASGQPAASLTISVSASDVSGQPAVSFGANTTVVALVNAPRATLSLGSGVNATGVFAGFFVTVGNNATLTFQSGLTPQSQQPAGSQQLSGYVTPEIAAAPIVGPVPDSTPLTLGIALPVQQPTDFPALEDFAKQVSDPTHPRYRQYLTPAQYATHYAPSQATYDAAKAFALSQGLSIYEYPDHELLEITGTAAQLGRATNAQFNYYQRPDGSQFYAIDREPSLNLSVSVLQVSGTDGFYVQKPGFPTEAPGTGDGGAYSAKDMRNAYFSSCDTTLDGTGQAIALVEFEGFNAPDYLRYSDIMGIPRGPSLVIRNIHVDSIISQYYHPFADPVGAMEAPLDVDVADAIAPGAQIVIYQAPSSSQFGIDLQARMFHDIVHPPNGVPLANQVSSSWFTHTTAEIRHYVDAMGAQGQSFVEASGDGGAYTVNPGDLRSYSATVVGGTVLSAFGTGIRPSEVAWSSLGYSGGGGFLGPASEGIFNPTFHTPVSMPAYQLGMANALNGASNTYRNVPDVSLLSGNKIEIVYTNNIGAPSTLGATGGTSAAAPMFAGFLALTNQASAARHVAPVGFANPTLYAIERAGGALATAAFNDVVAGNIPPVANIHGFVDSTFATSPVPAAGFNAVPGYDLATGLGSPTCTLLDQLATLTPATPLPPTSISFAGIGRDNACGIVAGTLECWGMNKEAEDKFNSSTGVIDTNQYLTPTCTFGTMPMAGVSMGSDFGCGITAQGAVSCWGGSNFNGQLGPNGGAQSPPRLHGVGQIPGFGPNTAAGEVVAVQISSGWDNTCVLGQDSNVYCWGENDVGELGTGAPVSEFSPNVTKIQGLPPVRQVAVTSGRYACALLQDGGVDCWGSNAADTLGDGVDGSAATASSATPQPVLVSGVGATGTRLMNVTALSTGQEHACAVSQGNLFCWGNNSAGQLGQGNLSMFYSSHAALATLLKTDCTGPDCGTIHAPVKSVGCGLRYTCALLETGHVECFGENRAEGKLGDGTTTDRYAPRPVTGLNGVQSLIAGDLGACAQLQNGSLSCWGDGPIGDGTVNPPLHQTPITFARCQVQ